MCPTPHPSPYWRSAWQRLVDKLKSEGDPNDELGYAERRLQRAWRTKL